MTVRDNQWTLHYYVGDNSYALYDSVNDPQEINNVIKDHPKVVKALKAKMREYLTTKAIRPNTDNNLPKYKQLIAATK